MFEWWAELRGAFALDTQHGATEIDAVRNEPLDDDISYDRCKLRR
jgi:hypothetical protein